MMSIHVRWHNDTKKTMIVTYDREWTWAHFAEAKVQIDTMLDSVGHMVDIVSDSRMSGGLPRGNAMTVLARSFQSAPSNIGMVIVIGANPFFKSLLQILQTVSLNRAAKNIRFAKSPQDANSMLDLGGAVSAV